MTESNELSANGMAVASAILADALGYGIRRSAVTAVIRGSISIAVMASLGFADSSRSATAPLPAPISRISRPSCWVRSSRAMAALLERHAALRQKARSNRDIAGI
jgi:hypothetical protein